MNKFTILGQTFFVVGLEGYNEWLTHYYHPEIHNFYRKTQDKCTLIDLGACLGVFSLLFATRPYSVAHAVEPSPAACRILSQNIAANPQYNIILYPYLVAQHSYHTLPTRKCWKHVYVETGRQTQDECGPKLTTISLDDLCEMHKIVPDCIKCDVEGYEVKVIKGGGKTLASRPLLFLEQHGPHFGQDMLKPYGDNVEELDDLLQSLGYSIFDTQDRKLDHVWEANHVMCV